MVEGEGVVGREEECPGLVRVPRVSCVPVTVLVPGYVSVSRGECTRGTNRSTRRQW